MAPTSLQLFVWLMSLPPILDGHGYPIARPPAAARVIAAVAVETSDPAFFAAALDVFAAHESGYRPSAAGDCPGMRSGDPQCTRELGARSCGAWQTPCATTPRDATAQARQWVAILRRSTLACPAHPFAVLGTGRCLVWGAPREREVQAALFVAFPSDDAVAAR
jgi:hypothetical protein